MLGRSVPVFVDNYSSRRARRKLPRWPLVLLAGLVAGAAGVVYVQERHLPPRLSMEAAARLRASFDEAERERQRLQAELVDATKRLETAMAEQKTLAGELATSRRSNEDLREQVGALVDALPPDPRGGAIQVRAARFNADGGALAYDVVLTREQSRGKPFAGVMRLTLNGSTAGGGETTVELEPVAVSVGRFQSVNGSVPLPEGFTPRQSTIQIRDRDSGSVMGMRVLHVR